MASPDCFGCGGSAPDGLEICGQYLCGVCEAKLIHCRAEKLEYQHWIDKCRDFWDKIKIDLKDGE